MKLLISILIGLLVVGCGKKQSTNTNEGSSTPIKTVEKNVEKETPSKSDDSNITTPKSVKELTKEDVVGTYELELRGNTNQLVILENGIGGWRFNGEKGADHKWRMSGHEVHVRAEDDDMVGVYKKNPDGDLNFIAQILDGKPRPRDFPRDEQLTFKKINPEATEIPSKVDDNNSTGIKLRELTAEDMKVVGAYERRANTFTEGFVFLENGVGETYLDGKKTGEVKWKILDGEIYVEKKEGEHVPVIHEDIFFINRDGSLSWIAGIVDGKRKDFSKESQEGAPRAMTWEKIK